MGTGPLWSLWHMGRLARAAPRLGRLYSTRPITEASSTELLSSPSPRLRTHRPAVRSPHGHGPAAGPAARLAGDMSQHPETAAPPAALVSPAPRHAAHATCADPGCYSRQRAGRDLCVYSTYGI